MKSLWIFLFFLATTATAQDNPPFWEEVQDIQKKYAAPLDASKETVVFTGSSSVRLWKDLAERFPKYQIVNSGFGGSQAVDLLRYVDPLILDFKPKKVFIYEGDNDIFSKKKGKDILETFNNIIKKIKTQNPNTQIVIISPKPSLSRWKFRGKYRRLNKKLQKLSETDVTIAYADVWHIMLDGRRPIKDIFIEDGLHMNAKGYELWFSVIKNYLN